MLPTGHWPLNAQSGSKRAVGVIAVDLCVGITSSGDLEPVSKHQQGLNLGCVKNGPADAGWDGRTCLAKPNSQARSG